MSARSDWLPSNRDGQLAMAMKWNTVLAMKGDAWSVPPEKFTDLNNLTLAAQAALNAASSKDRTKVLTAKVNEAFAALIAAMRDMKKRYFLQPPLLDSDLASLDLSPRDTNPTSIGVPTGQASAVISYPGPGMLMLHISLLEGTLIDPKADYGYRVYYGVCPQGGATMDEALSPKRYLLKAPQTGEELPHSNFTRRRKELFMEEFTADSGKTAWFSIRLENAKGGKGPWGPLFSAIIP